VKSSHIQLFEISGKEIPIQKSEVGENNVKLMLNNLNNGMYLLKVNSPKGSIHKRFVLSK
jgi:hypothetical protein